MFRIVTLWLLLWLLTIAPAFAGGYVDGNVVLNPARAINTGAVSITPTFNNDQFNDQILVGTVNNDSIRTPSTADPVSTVTGNNYHDETDFVIKGRGLNYAFTRTYNSAPSSTRTNSPLGFGWSLPRPNSYGMYLQSNDYGDCPNCAAGTNTAAGQRPENGNNRTSSITYVDERGGAHNHLVNEGTLAIRPPQGEFEPLSASAANQYTLTFRNGTRYIFEPRSLQLTWVVRRPSGFCAVCRPVLHLAALAFVCAREVSQP